MGNNESVTAGNKAQADAAACDWYKLLALTGEGKALYREQVKPGALNS